MVRMKSAIPAQNTNSNRSSNTCATRDSIKIEKNCLSVYLFVGKTVNWTADFYYILNRNNMANGQVTIIFTLTMIVLPVLLHRQVIFVERKEINTNYG